MYRLREKGEKAEPNHQDAFPIEAEINIHKTLKHPNIISYVDNGIYRESSSVEKDESEKGCVFLVCELADHDLKGILATGFRFEEA
jgi:hypothetical protein